MKRTNINAAKKAALEFLDAVDLYDARYISDNDFAKFCEVIGYKETGAIRRASMDLTRALSQMRKP